MCGICGYISKNRISEETLTDMNNTMVHRGPDDSGVMVFDGDAAAVMHLGCLATIGRYQPKNLIHIVLNNGVNESVGGQPSAGQMIDLTSIAKACGYITSSIYVEKSSELKTMVEILSVADKPAFIDVHVRQGIRKDMPKLSIDHHLHIRDLMKLMTKE